MREKIGHFLGIMLVLCACLILAATGNSRPEDVTETTVRTQSPQDSIQTVPETTQAVPETTEAPSQTEGESDGGFLSFLASLLSGPEETRPESGTEPPEGVSRERVEQILQSRRLAETALPHCVYAPDLNETEGTDGAGEKAGAFVLAQLCAERKMNPVSAFWLLVSEGVYEKAQDATGVLAVPEFDIPAQEAKRYSYSDEGARLLIGDLLNLAGRMEDALGLEIQLLGANGKVEEDQVFFADGEDCFYGYFVCYGDRTAHFLCFYLRADDTGEFVTDVEFQLLNLSYATGEEASLAELALRGDRQTAALMAAAELLLTGQTALTGESVPMAYQVGDHSATVERFHFTGNGEEGTLTNYRIRAGE